MDIPFTVDLPPVPGCFIKLIAGETESESSAPEQPWKEAERLRELKDVMLKSLAQESLSTTPFENGEEALSESRTVETHNGSSKLDVVTNTPDDLTPRTLSLVELEQTMNTTKTTTPFRRLNTALGRLKREMVDLRYLDMSLFCQLLSLNEAIQDFKISVNDRYSEYTGSEYAGSEYTGSEYSFGEGMGSRTGSFSSLNDENDWSRDFRMHQEDPSSPLSPGDSGEGRKASDDLAASTSSFLQQIKALTKRVESDF